MAQSVSVVVTVSPAGQEEQQVVDDLRTALLGLATDAPYDVIDVILAPEPEDAETEQSLAQHRQRHQDLTPEDAPDGSNPRYVLGTLENRLVAFLRAQHDVVGIQEVGDGIYGFALVGTPNGVSLTISLTQ